MIKDILCMAAIGCVAILAAPTNSMDHLDINKLNQDQLTRPCCRCPADDILEMEVEAPIDEIRQEIWRRDDDNEDSKNTQQKRYVAPKPGTCEWFVRVICHSCVCSYLFLQDVPNVYRNGFFWKSRMCCECGI